MCSNVTGRLTSTSSSSCSDVHRPEASRSVLFSVLSVVLSFVWSDRVSDESDWNVMDCSMQPSKLRNLESTWTVTGGAVSVNQPWLQLYLAACKLLDLALILPADFLPQFQL